MFLEQALLVHCVVKVKCECIRSYIVIIHMVVPYYYKKDSSNLIFLISVRGYFGQNQSRS